MNNMAILVKEAMISTSQSSLSVSVAMSLVAFGLTMSLIPSMSDLFLKAGMSGKDLNKPTKPVIPEALGVICGTVYLITLFLFIPVPFLDDFVEPHKTQFPHQVFAKFLSALLSIGCMILLGFADDVLNLRWRHKIWLPTLATIPLLMVYLVSYNRTEVVIPKPLHVLVGETVDLGVLYYIYMGMLAVFCTNSINILAGINGVEAGQSLIIGLSIAINNVIQLSGTCCVEDHTFSLYIILPFLGVTSALLWHNWYPSRVFVGDTFCYFAGMTFAVSGILGHFSKTMLLFFVPQIFNFIFSAPQLFHLVDCPRHRMPKFNPKTGLVEPSQVNIKTVGFLGGLVIKIFTLLGLLEHRKDEAGNPTVNNFTLINLVLVKWGPMREDRATMAVMAIQVVCSLLAFAIRYPLTWAIY